MAGAIMIAVCLTGPANATPLFFDDFEGGLGKWSPNEFGQIVADPLNGSNSVLSFSQTNTGGDAFTSTTSALVAGQQYAVSFDFYGLSLANTSSGGYAGISAGTPGSHAWYAGTAPTSFLTVPDPLILADDVGAWQHYTYVFTAPIVLQGASTSAIRLMFEDFAFSGLTAGNAYFDNVALNAVPLPAALPLYGAGIAGLGLLGWIRRRKASTA
jgi:hypothetical protein